MGQTFLDKNGVQQPVENFDKRKAYKIPQNMIKPTAPGGPKVFADKMNRKADSELYAKKAEAVKSYGQGHDMKQHGEGKPYASK